MTSVVFILALLLLISSPSSRCNDAARFTYVGDIPQLCAYYKRYEPEAQAFLHHTGSNKNLRTILDNCPSNLDEARSSILDAYILSQASLISFVSWAFSLFITAGQKQRMMKGIGTGVSQLLQNLNDIATLMKRFQNESANMTKQARNPVSTPNSDDHRDKLKKLVLMWDKLILLGNVSLFASKIAQTYYNLSLNNTKLDQCYFCAVRDFNQTYYEYLDQSLLMIKAAFDFNNTMDQTAHYMLHKLELAVNEHKQMGLSNEVFVSITYGPHIKESLTRIRKYFESLNFRLDILGNLDRLFYWIKGMVFGLFEMIGPIILQTLILIPTTLHEYYSRNSPKALSLANLISTIIGHVLILIFGSIIVVFGLYMFINHQMTITRPTHQSKGLAYLKPFCMSLFLAILFTIIVVSARKLIHRLGVSKPAYADQADRIALPSPQEPSYPIDVKASRTGRSSHRRRGNRPNPRSSSAAGFALNRSHGTLMLIPASISVLLLAIAL